MQLLIIKFSWFMITHEMNVKIRSHVLDGHLKIELDITSFIINIKHVSKPKIIKSDNYIIIIRS